MNERIEHGHACNDGLRYGDDPNPYICGGECLDDDRARLGAVVSALATSVRHAVEFERATDRLKTELRRGA